MSRVTLPRYVYIRLLFEHWSYFFLLCSNVNRRLSRIARGEGFGIQQRRLEAKSAVDVEIDENRLNRGKEVLRSILKVTLSIV